MMLTERCPTAAAGPLASKLPGHGGSSWAGAYRSAGHARPRDRATKETQAVRRAETAKAAARTEHSPGAGPARARISLSGPGEL
jgi:hypothetical protein